MVALDDRVIGSNLGTLVALSPDPIVLWGISTAPDTKGQVLFNAILAKPARQFNNRFRSRKLTRRRLHHAVKRYTSNGGLSVLTHGQLVWGPSDREVQLNIFDVVPAIAEGKFFSMGQGGVLYAYDAKTGQKLWNYTVDDPYSEILWSNNWPMRILFISDGKIYIGHEEHSGNSPLPRGAPFVCLNTTTGDVVWSIDGGLRQNHWGGRAIIGDSIIATADTYDNRIYAIGKGPSSTTLNRFTEIRN